MVVAFKAGVVADEMVRELWAVARRLSLAHAVQS